MHVRLNADWLAGWPLVGNVREGCDELPWLDNCSYYNFMLVGWSVACLADMKKVWHFLLCSYECIRRKSIYWLSQAFSPSQDFAGKKEGGMLHRCYFLSRYGNGYYENSLGFRRDDILFSRLNLAKLSTLYQLWERSLHWKQRIVDSSPVSAHQAKVNNIEQKNVSLWNVL